MSATPQLFQVSEIGRTRGVRALSYECREGPGAPRRDEQHRSHCIAFVQRGRFTYHLNGIARAMGPGSWFLGNAGGDYTCTHEQGVGDDCIAFEYKPEVLDEIAREAGYGRSANGSFFALPALPSIPQLEPTIWALLRTEHLSAEEAAYEVAYSVITELGSMEGIKSRRRLGGAPTERDFDRANDAMAFIEQRATKESDLSLADICERVGTSPFHFLRTFKSVVGITPHQYLVRHRVRHAANLLRDSAMPVTEIAFDSGFGDLSNFVRSFRSFFGCSPRSFRQSPPVRIARFAK